MQTTHRATRAPRRRPCTGDLPRVVVALGARTALWTVLLLAAWSVLPAALGWQVTTVVSGSMTPAIAVGDVVAAMPVDPERIGAGHVLLVDDPDHEERLRLHRVERVLDDGTYRLRGDANPAADRSPVAAGAVHGVGVLRFPGVGLPGLWLRTGQWTALLAAAAALGLLAVLARADRSLRAGTPCGRCGSPRWTPGNAVVDGDDVRHRSILVASAAAIAVALVASTGADATFSGSTTTQATMASSGSFPCFRKALDDPALAWDFDEPSGGVVDRSGHGKDGHFSGSVARQSASCADDPWITFAPVADDPRVLSDAAAPGPTTFSTEVWFRTTTVGGAIASFGSDHGPASTYKDRITYVNSNGTLTFGVQGSNSFRYAVRSDVPVTDGAWHHAVAVSRPGRMQLWVDGRPSAARTDNASPSVYTGSWRLGRQSYTDWPLANATVFSGDVDTFRVYDRVLDEATIATHFAAGR